MKISACLITKNEEKTIESCLGSFKDIVDEIIVIDTGSTDNTIEIAKRLGSSIFHYKWDDNFSNPRNYALEKVTGDWVIFLDADEYFTTGTRRNVLKVINEIHRNNKSVNALVIRRFNIDNSDGKVKTIDYMLRIFRNNKKIKYVGKIHENVQNDGKPMEYFVVPEDTIAIKHTGYSKNIIKEKAERNLQLLLSNLTNGLDDKMTYIYLSDCYLELENYDKAIEFANLFIFTRQVTFGYNVKPYINIITAMIKKGQRKTEVLHEIDRALNKFPNHPEFYRFSGIMYLLENSYSNALNAFKKSIIYHFQYDSVETNNMSSYLYEVYYFMALINIEKGDFIKALDFLVKSLNENPFNKNSFDYLIKLIKDEDTKDIILLLRNIYNEQNEKDLEFLIRNLSSHKIGKVLLFYNNKWTKEFNNEDSSIMFTLLSNQQYEKAFQLFTQCYFEEYSEWTALYSVVSAMLSGNIANINYIKKYVNPTLKRIITLNYEDSSQLLLKNDCKVYIEILRELLLLGNENQVDKFINLKTSFEQDVSFELGNFLFENWYFELAIQQYQSGLKTLESDYETLDIKQKTFYISKIGICYYKLSRYDESIIYIEEAIRFGYKEKDLFEYLYFMLEHNISDSSKSRIMNLLKEK